MEDWVQAIKDILTILRDVLLIVVLAGIIYFWVAMSVAIDEYADQFKVPDTVVPSVSSD
jgi:preprotein translocase subunit SecY